jgi:hypothetical protein
MGIKLLSEGLINGNVASVNKNVYGAGFTLNSMVSTASLATRTSPGATSFICYPFRPKANFRPNSVSIEVTTTGTGNAIVFLFETLANSTTILPNRQVFNVSFPVNTTGVKTATSVTISDNPFSTPLNLFTLKANTLYWWAINYNCSLRSIPIANTEPITLISTTVTANSVIGTSASIDVSSQSLVDLLDATPAYANNVLPNINLITTTF